MKSERIAKADANKNLQQAVGDSALKPVFQSRRHIRRRMIGIWNACVPNFAHACAKLCFPSETDIMTASVRQVILTPWVAFNADRQAAQAAEEYSRGQASPSAARAAHGRAASMFPMRLAVKRMRNGMALQMSADGALADFPSTWGKIAASSSLLSFDIPTIDSECRKKELNAALDCNINVGEPERELNREGK